VRTGGGAIVGDVNNNGVLDPAIGPTAAETWQFAAPTPRIVTRASTPTPAPSRPPT
jgi:hypothetical protein